MNRMKKKTQLELTFKLPIDIKKDEDVGYVSHCPPLDVWSQGKTKAEAEKNIKEAVNLFVVSCLERGTIFNVMAECGFKAISKKQPKKRAKTPPFKHINVSIPFSANEPATHTSACLA